MTDTFEFTLNNPLTEEQWDMIADVDFDHTDRIWFHTKHGKEVEFAKVKHGEWIEYPTADGMNQCSICGVLRFGESNYCPNCGAKMDAERKEE